MQLALELHWGSSLSSACDEEGSSSPQHLTSLKYVLVLLLLLLLLFCLLCHSVLCYHSDRNSMVRAIEHCSWVMRGAHSLPSRVFATLSMAILTIKHKLDILDSILDNRPGVDLSLHLLYQNVNGYPTHRSLSQPSFSSIHSGRSSPTLAFPLVASTKSLLSSKHSLTAKSSLLSTPTHCSIQCGPHSFPYGYEYSGSAARKLVLTPATERCLFTLLQSCAQYKAGMMTGTLGSGGPETALELAQVCIIGSLVACIIVWIQCC